MRPGFIELQEIHDSKVYFTKGERTRSYGKGKKEKNSLMYNASLKNYWLDRIERRKKAHAKQVKINSIVDNVGRKIKLAKFYC